jgi:hypothetical protein
VSYQLDHAPAASLAALPGAGNSAIDLCRVGSATCGATKGTS